jgi:hypothetical protein
MQGALPGLAFHKTVFKRDGWCRDVERRPGAGHGCAFERAIEEFDCVARTSLDDAN